MNTPQNGYPVQQYHGPVKRYCQTLDLRDNPELIAEYRKRHSKEHAWKEIIAGIREVGIRIASPMREPGEPVWRVNW